jgi:membrane protein implicated in regulation of membrane protease activity
VSLATIGLLWLEGLALGSAGLWGGRPGLTAAGVVLVLGGCFTLWIWRRYRRALEEIQAERAGMRNELQEIRSLLRSR